MSGMTFDQERDAVRKRQLLDNRSDTEMAELIGVSAGAYHKWMHKKEPALTVTRSKIKRYLTLIGEAAQEPSPADAPESPFPDSFTVLEGRGADMTIKVTATHLVLNQGLIKAMGSPTHVLFACRSERNGFRVAVAPCAIGQEQKGIRIYANGETPDWFRQTRLPLIATGRYQVRGAEGYWESDIIPAATKEADGAGDRE